MLTHFACFLCVKISLQNQSSDECKLRMVVLQIWIKRKKTIVFQTVCCKLKFSSHSLWGYFLGTKCLKSIISPLDTILSTIKWKLLWKIRPKTMGIKNEMIMKKKKKKILRKSVPDNYWQTGYLFNFLYIPFISARQSEIKLLWIHIIYLLGNILFVYKMQLFICNG